jgi:hypothetical protein
MAAAEARELDELLATLGQEAVDVNPQVTGARSQPQGAFSLAFRTRTGS